MPPKIKITEEDIVSAAIRFVREKGFENLNARDLAAVIGCSVHPIFRAFETMDKLKSAVCKKAESIYNQRMISCLEQEDGFLAMGLTYIDFAKNDKNLFKLLFMSDAFQNQNISNIAGSTEGDDDVIEMLCQMTGLSVKRAKELYTNIWLTTHGIATMCATNSCYIDEEEVRHILNNSFTGVLMKLKSEESK